MICTHANPIKFKSRGFNQFPDLTQLKISPLIQMTIEEQPKLSVAFVCLGNICRSPMAEAIFRHTVKTKNLDSKFDLIDSFGTGAYHIGESPDRRSSRTCKSHGVPVSHKAQQIRTDHFHKFDWILAMDENNYEDLIDLKPKNSKARVAMFGEFGKDPNFAKTISDPYYGGDAGFETNFHQITHFSEEFIKSAL